MEANSGADMTNSTVHQLVYDFDLHETKTDSRILPFCAVLYEPSFPDHTDQNMNFWRGLKMEVPSDIWFVYYDFLVRGVDYIYTDQSYPIVSKRMIEVLESVGSFEHLVHPVQFKQTQPTLQGEDLGAEREFYILNCLGRINILDLEKSKCTRGPLGLRTITHAVFKEPQGSLPPFFIERNFGGGVHLVSDEAKQALEAAGIVGVKFWPPKFP